MTKKETNFRKKDNKKKPSKELLKKKNQKSKPAKLVQKKRTAAKAKPAKSVQIIPLGGLDKIGMNITAIRYADEMIVVDCGISFPDEEMLGIDKVIPDVTFLEENRSIIKGFFITHGHEDHIGAIPYIIPKLNVPIYATNLTMGLIDHKLEEAGIVGVKKKVVRQGQTIKLGSMKVEFIKTNHSIPGACALAIYTPAGTVFHTGDFKVDYTPLFGDAIDLQRIAEIGKDGVLALLSDSTNAMRPGFTPSEIKVAETFDSLFAEHSRSRIIVATFSSNLDRVQQLIDTAKKYNRKVILQGRSMETAIEIGAKLGIINVPKSTIIDVEEMNNYPDNKLVFITTGSQGEAMASLSRMASGQHKKVTIKPGDAIVFSSSPIPGNERAVSKVMNELAEKGAKIIYQDTHVSGHACQQEIQLIYTLLKPKYAVPVHGEYRHLMANAEIASSLGIPSKNTFILTAGDVLELSEKKGEVKGKVQAGEVYVDGLSVGDVGDAVIRDRQNLAEKGILMVTLAIEPGSGEVVAGPEIITRGFIYVKESGDVMDEMRAVVMDSIYYCRERRIKDFSKIRSVIKKDLDDFIWKKYQRTPMILPVILEVR